MSSQKVILITGSSKGMGAETARNFASHGHRAIINYHRSEKEAGKLLAEIEKQAGRKSVMMCRADVACRDDVQALFKKAIAEFGKVDVLINDAGINLDGPFMEMTDEQWDRVIATVLKGTFICSQEFARHFQGQEGHIINIGASTGLRGRRNGANYCAAKAGVINLTKCLALELAPHIRVNCIIPGYIETDELMNRYHLEQKENLAKVLDAIPLGRLGTPADIFKVMNFIINEADYITGQNFFINGGHFMY
jgi:NAD(P)-dependent dehydrogenase (short-subunit alcohol dehydrogenase family)